MSKVTQLVVASQNHGKLRELRLLLEHLPLHVVSVGDVLGPEFEVIEDGDSFEANALKKARAVQAATGCWALADDSGLEVDALGGCPGVQSARYAGLDATDADNNAKLLRELFGVRDRRGRFRCVLALVGPGGELELAHGSCEGTIADEARGAGGFGYDPLFLPAGLDGLSMAELSLERKNRISHRAAAQRALLPALRRLLAAT